MRGATTFPTLDTEAIRRASNIAAVVGRYVQLRKAGRELVGLCPFHKEKSGSFYVNPEKNGGVYHCHGCDSKGDVFTFIEKIGVSVVFGRKVALRNIPRNIRSLHA